MSDLRQPPTPMQPGDAGNYFRRAQAFSERQQQMGHTSGAGDLTTRGYLPRRIAQQVLSSGGDNRHVWEAGSGIVYPPGPIPYLNDEMITVDEMNALFAELDRRTGLPLDNKSILYLLQTSRGDALQMFAPYLGPIAGAWVAGPQLITGYWGGAKTPTANAARRRTFQQAELLFEGQAFTSLNFLAAWNEYDIFRAHNCNATALTIRFLNTAGAVAHTLTVEPYSSKCVRRTGVDGAYTEGYHYFQKFVAGDPRFYQATNVNGFGCNLINPSIAIPFVNHVLAGRPFTLGGFSVQFAAPTVLLDPHVRGPLPDEYEDFYGDAASDGTLLGDVLHCAGEIIDVKSLPADLNHPTATRFTFDGYGSLAALPVATRQVGDDLQIQSNDLTGAKLHDFISLSTNFFCTGAANFITHPVVDGTQWFTLDRHMPTPEISAVQRVTVPRKLRTTTVLTINSDTSARGYDRLKGAGNTGFSVPLTTDFQISLAQQFFSLVGPANFQNLRPHQHTLAEVKNIATFQNLPAVNTDSTFTSTTMELTAGGLVLQTIQTIPLTAPFTDANYDAGLSPLGLSSEAALSYYLASPFVPVLSPALRHHITRTGSSIVIKRAVVFTGYGFPDTDAWFNTGFLTRRSVRTYSDRPISGALPASGPHPDFSEGAHNANGDEVVYNGDSAFIDTEIAVPSPLNDANDARNREADANRGLVIGTLSNNDVLAGAVKHHLDPGYWNGGTGAPAPVETNRKRCHANRIFYGATNAQTEYDGACYSHAAGGIDALDIKRFWRMEMAVEHYNNLAAKVNSMSRYKVLNWDDHGVLQNGSDQTARYRLSSNPNRGLLPSPTNDFDTLADIPIRPADQYTSFLPGTEDGLRDIFRAAGVPIRALGDLPQSFFDARAAFQTTIRCHGTAAATNVTIDGTQSDSGELFGRCTIAFAGFDAPVQNATKIRPDLNAITVHDWVKIQDIKAFAEARGYKFLYTQFGVPLNLKQFDLPAPGAVLTNPTAFVDGQTRTPTANRSGAVDFTYVNRFFEFVNDGGGDWLTGYGKPIIITDVQPYDILRTNFVAAMDQGGLFRVPIILKIDAPPELRRRFVKQFNRPAGVPICQIYFNFDHFGVGNLLPSNYNEAQSVVSVNYSSVPTPNVQVLYSDFVYPVPDLNPVAMSESGNDAAVASTIAGDVVFKPKAGTARRAQLWADFTTAY